MAISLEELKSLLRYDSESGVFVWCHMTPRKKTVAGTIAGGRRPDGYVLIQVMHKSYLAHRLAWFYAHGTWPDDLIDHINGNPSDNRMCNLRQATKSTNALNQRTRKPRSSTGRRGVCFDGRRNKFFAHVKVSGVRHFLGYFDCPDAAEVAYLSAKRELCPGII